MVIEFHEEKEGRRKEGKKSSNHYQKQKKIKRTLQGGGGGGGRWIFCLAIVLFCSLILWDELEMKQISTDAEFVLNSEFVLQTAAAFSCL